MEPMFTLKNSPISTKILRKMGGIIRRIFPAPFTTRFSYNGVWKEIINRQTPENHIPGAFVDWDNTPRKIRRGLICKGASPELFGYFFQKQYQKAIHEKAEFLFFNAWNEWAEGTYLEPDEKFGFGYLEKIKNVIEKNNGRNYSFGNLEKFG